MDPLAASTLLGTWGYPALLLLLLLTGFGSPIPEDLLLLAAGYLVFSDTVSVASHTGCRPRGRRRQ